MRLLPTLTCSLIACLALLAGGVAAPQAGAASRVSCVEIDLPVSVLMSVETVHGQLCLPAGSAPTTVQLLIPGGTYNHVYWDFPYQPERYSYQRDMARTGRVGGVRFDRVVLVGHSLGSAVATLEAATYHDVDGVILTGATHLASALPVVRFFAIFVYPVALDPQLRKKNGGDPGYFTTRPDQREPAFYVTSNADPQVISIDEATKDRASISGIGTAAFDLLGPASLGIDVPVLLAVGEQDLFFCGFLARDCSSAEVLRKQEALYFSPAAELSTYVLPEAGHAMALHKNAGEYREATRVWLRARFGARDQQ